MGALWMTLGAHIVYPLISDKIWWDIIIPRANILISVSATEQQAGDNNRSVIPRLRQGCVLLPFRFNNKIWEINIYLRVPVTI